MPEGTPLLTEQEQVKLIGPEAIIAGLKVLRELGVTDPTLVGSIMLDAGDPAGQCRGSVAELIGQGGHANIIDGISRTVKTAVETDQDPVESLASAMSFLVKRDESGEIVTTAEVHEVARIAKKKF